MSVANEHIVSIDDQIACVERELAFRKRCFPKWVDSGELNIATAALEIDRMEAVLRTLEEIRDRADDDD